MRDFKNYVSTREVGKRNSNGIAYVIIPAEESIPREVYIKDCLSKSKVALLFEDGGFYENALVGKNVWNYLQFPLTSDKLGSCVFWNYIKKSNTIIVIDVIQKSDDVLNQFENEFLLKRTFNNNVISISGNSKTNILSINVQSDDSTQNKLNINVTNSNKSSVLNIFVKGNIEIESDGKTTLKSTNNLNLIFKDEKGLIENKFEILNNGFCIKTKQESFFTLFNLLLNEIESAIILTPSGAGTISPSTTIKLETIRTKFNTLFNNGSN